MTILRLGCETATPRRLKVNGLELHLLESGVPGASGVCFLHGGSAHAHWFDLVTPPLADRFHVIALDQRGHGESQWPAEPAYSSEDFAADLTGVMDALGWRRMALVGHSMGGHNAMAFAAWQPERVAALAIVDSRPAIASERLARVHARGVRPPRVRPSVEDAIAAFRLLPPETLARPELLAHLAREGLVRHDGGWTYRFDPACTAKRQPVDAWPLLPRIAAPTLIVRGQWSPILPADLAARMASQIPNASVAEVPGVYHHLVLDRPDLFNEMLGRFLDKTVGAGADRAGKRATGRAERRHPAPERSRRRASRR